jgi:hypothetical protein
MTDHKKHLEDVPPEKVFRFENGTAARNIYELLDHLQNMDSAQFSRYSNKEKDDFAKWINEVIGDNKLGASLQKIKDKSAYETQIEQRIRNLERNALLSCFWTKCIFRWDEECEKKIFVFSLVATILIISLVFLAAIYTRLDQRITSFEDSVQMLQERDVLLYQLQLQNLARIQNLTRISNMESPSSLEKYFFSGENIAPSNKISEEQIQVYDDKVVISVQNVSWAKFLDTGSMLPTLSENANSLEIAPTSPKDINEGDIITYRSTELKDLIIHRVVEIGEDDQGWYAMTKGDNNKLIDPYKVRFDQIERILIGVIY